VARPFESVTVAVHHLLTKIEKSLEANKKRIQKRLLGLTDWHAPVELERRPRKRPRGFHR
jgi:hypothetical protein